MSKYLKVSVSYEDLEAAVKRVICDRIGLEEPFTAFDITKILREDVGTSVNIGHDEVRDIVHELMETVCTLGIYDKIDGHEITYNTFAILYEPSATWKPAKNNLKINIPSIGLDSTLVSSMAFSGDDEKGAVTIELHDDFYNKTYVYADVPFTTFLEVINAESVGQAYNQLIKGQYSSERI